jgi:ceramide glucosyltransferase
VEILQHGISQFLFVGAAAGTVALLAQLYFVVRYRRASRAQPIVNTEGISILKPLCGRDDALVGNLESFAAINHPNFELLLGVKDQHDPAFDVALAFARKHKRFVRLVLQRGEPGFNPKVNQLITMAEVARNDLTVISDSNVRVERDYLNEFARAFQDPTVGCVTHPVIGGGESQWGSLLDNLHLSTTIGPGMIGAKLAVDQDVVVGKSMAIRNSDLRKLGGWASMKDILAEDYVLGRAIRSELGKRVVLGETPVVSFSRDKPIHHFFRRYGRWSVIHRTVLAPSTYLAQTLINPIPLSLAAFCISPSKTAALACGSIIYAKVAIDLAVAHTMGYRVTPRAVPAVALKDLLLFLTWMRGFTCRTVDWRGNLLKVTHGSRLIGRDAHPDGLSAGANEAS